MKSRVDQWELVIAVGRLTEVPSAASSYGLSSYRVACALDKLARLAKTLTRYYEWQCNEDTAPHTCKACGGSRPGPHTYTNCAGAKVYALQERAESIGKDIGVVVENQTDPRGASIKIWADKVDGQLLGVMS